ncbi:hypothetical protein H7F10_07080 [Acidithiobacillus sp. HP-6]|uniref:hypothetical protein n=1 Tax=unclassified Acidithiobacillus TaxID=2614800 RepID=UPI00187A6760|nr:MULTISPECIES: hypothetical protein [unclassified Acidithiobacillus]MBE7562715.1 hypothetical protein [Acidithiobacillus sp. HP-6]MBE7570489.1 hypothetical protein [Acidithiobacillus sp. HP-2]
MKFPNFKKNKNLPERNEWAFRKLPEPKRSVRSNAGPRSAYLIVWGIIFLLAGLGMAGWGGYNTYTNINVWQTERAGLKQIASYTPQKLADLRAKESQGGGVENGLVGMLLSSPFFLKIAVAKMENAEIQAQNNLILDFPLTILGLFFIFWGNGMLRNS